MSQGIRDQIHNYLEVVLDDARCGDIHRLLQLAATKHSVPFTLKATFDVAKIRSRLEDVGWRSAPNLAITTPTVSAETHGRGHARMDRWDLVA